MIALFLSYDLTIHYSEKFEDTKGTTIIRKSKDIKYNGQNKSVSLLSSRNKLSESSLLRTENTQKEQTENKVHVKHEQ
jgi:hypothetical protein